MNEPLSFGDFTLIQFAALLRAKRPAFFRRGACEGTGHELFFPSQGQSSMVKKAKLVCSDCPVVYECLRYAMDNAIEHGVWGCSSPAERKRWLAEGYTVAEAFEEIDFLLE